MKDDKIKKPFYKRWWVWLLAVIVVWSIATSGNKDKENNKAAPSPTTGINQSQTSPGPASKQNTPSPEPTKKAEATKEPDIWIKEGMYKVGKDIAAGEYVLMSTSAISSYYQVSKDSSGSLESIISNDNFKGSRYVTVAEGQYLETKGAKLAPVDKAPVLKPADGKYTEGMYKAGRDIPAGEYKVIPEGSMSYVEVAKDSKGSIDSIVTNDNFSAEKYITIKDGQYIKLVGCYIKT